MGVLIMPPATRRPLYLSTPLHLWKLNDVSSPWVNSGTRSLTMSNTGTVGTGGVTANQRGLLEYGVDFLQGGATDRPVIYTANPASGDVVTGKSLTVGCLVQFRAANVNGYCVQKMYDSTLANWNATYVGATWELGINSSGNFIFAVVQGAAGAGTRSAASAAYGPTLGVPYYLAGVYDGGGAGTVTLFVNGVIAAVTSAITGNIDNSTTNSNNGGPYAIGGTASTNTAGNSLTCSALIEEVSIEGAVRTQANIRDRFARIYSGDRRTARGFPI